MEDKEDKKREKEVDDGEISEERVSSEDESEDNESSEGEGDPKKSSNKELYWILGTMAAMVIVFLAASMMFRSMSTFEYEGLTFPKEKFGEIPVFHYYYFIENHLTGAVIAKYNLYLRNDPRKNDVPIEGEIEFEYGKDSYISISATGLDECEMSSVAVGSLSAFLTDNQLRPKGAVPNESQAEELGVEYATCDNTNSVVMLIQEGNETRIDKVGNKCHVISVNNCEIIEAVEKFQLQTLIDARDRAGLS